MHVKTLTAIALAGPLAAAQSQSPLPHAPTPERQDGTTAPSSLFWGDYDRDGLADAWVVQPDGHGRLLHNAGDGTFEDVTRQAGLADLKGAHLATWADANGDGRLDVYLAAYRGASRLLLQTEGGTFEDATDASGLPKHAEPVDALWFDYDGDRRPDLWLTTLHDDLVYHNAGGGRFEKVDLGLVPRVDREAEPPVDVNRARRMRGLDPIEGDTTITTSSSGPGAPGLNADLICTIAVQDASSPTNCLPASSDPMLGHLYPISNDWFVESGTGNVGIGTTSPSARLDVAGDVRAAGQLVSTATSGAPFAVASSDLVTSLNADRVDGFDASAFSQLGSSIGTAELELDSVTSAQIADDAVGASELAPDSVGSDEIADGSVTAADLAPGSVGNAQLGPDSVSSLEIVNASVQAEDLSPGSVTGTSILDGSITAADLGGDSVTSTAIAAGAVGSAEIAINAVNSLRILDGTIQFPDLAANSVAGSTIVDGQIFDVDIAPSAAIAGTKILPDFGTQDVTTAGTGSFEAGIATERAVTGSSTVGGPVKGYLGIQGATDFDGHLNADWAGLEIAVAGVSTGLNTPTDNFGVLGLSNGVGVRGENADFPGFNYGELGGVGVGVFGTGVTYGGQFDVGGLTSVALSANNHLFGNIIEASNGTPSTGYDLEFRVDSSGSVYCDLSFIGGGADYAEWLERANLNETFEPGDVVGVDGGLVSKDLTGAEQIMVLSTKPAVLGNSADADEDERAGFEMVAFLGQVPVRVRGPVREGDLLLPSGHDDGTAVAVAPREITSADLARVIGTAWESAEGEGVHRVNCAIGIDQAKAAAVVIDRLRHDAAALEDRVATLEALVAEILEQR